MDTNTPSGGTGTSSSAGTPATSNGNAHSGRNFAKSFARGEVTPREPAAPAAAREEVKTPFTSKNRLDVLPEVDEDSTESTEHASMHENDSDESEVQEDSQEDSQEEDDFSWMESLKAHKQLHGLELSDIVAALAEGRLPDELHDIIKIKLKSGDEEWELPLSKARKEAMLHQDYTRKMQAWNRERDEFNGEKNEFIEMLQTWKGNPEALLTGLERLEFPVLDAAKLLAKRMRELDEMSPRERELYESKQKYERELATMKQEQARNQHKQTTQQQQDAVKRTVDNVSTVAKQLFAKNNIPHDEKTWGRFLHNFEILSSGVSMDKWSQDMIENAFDATAADYNQALAKRGSQQAAAKPAPQKQQFDSPAREAVAKLQGKVAPRRAPKAGGPVRGSEFMKNLLGKR